ncbi:LysR family transcriptional regulator [Shewanella algicola]|uniref:LysR family transcriptional regulator n=1 Tax=Shewanella algicola TaxID=640633 RepID=A0A9X1Z9B3_9GAMM|nr:LysR family transcriptional regulator [Shewanella algicola]MCL1107734.1 LysR family transcriptional regulator [Shewanella algicola]GGP72352.1 LysR family transcriptional regulator [Shewanella algicola]
MADTKAIQQLDLNLLKIFEALYFEQNMTLAAKSLFITPSAVSHAIKRLRLVLNDPLFVRQGQQMQATAACQRMAPQLINALNRIRQVLQQCGEFDPLTTEQTFNIAIHEALESQLMPALITHVAKLIPHAKICSMALSREHISRQLSNGEVDLAIDVARAVNTPLMHMPLLSDPFCVLIDASQQPELANNFNQQAYLSAEHVAVSSRPIGRVMEDLLLQQQGINRLIKYRCQSYQTAAKMVLGSRLILTLPRSIAEQFIDPNLLVCAMPFSLTDIDTHLYWHSNTETDQALSWLRQQVVRVVQINQTKMTD